MEPIWGKSVLGRGGIQCQGPGVRGCLACVRNSSWVELNEWGGETGDEVIEVGGRQIRLSKEHILGKKHRDQFGGYVNIPHKGQYWLVLVVRWGELRSNWIWIYFEIRLQGCDVWGRGQRQCQGFWPRFWPGRMELLFAEMTICLLIYLHILDKIET